MNNYNSIAFYYNFLVRVVFGNAIDKAQEKYIAQLPNKGCLLIIGGGHGKILKQINSQKPDLRIDYIDKSIKMLTAAQKVNQRGNTHFILGDENSIRDKTYDGIITFFFLDLFHNSKRNLIIKKLLSHLKNDGTWLVADFNLPRNWKQQIIEKAMFRFLKATTKIEANKIDDYRLNLKKQTLKEIRTTYFYNAFIFSAVFRKRSPNY